jgi:hypothetical protein
VTTNIVLLGSLYTAELCALLVVLALYRLDGKGTVSAFLLSRPGVLCLAAASGLVLSGLMVIVQFRRSRSSDLRPFAFTAAMNLLVVVLSVGLTELAMRLLSVKTATGVKLGTMLLYPRQWEDVVSRNSVVFQEAAMQETFSVFDELLGWTIRPNYASEDGLYFSSREGLRSPTPGVALAERAASCRIALIGDSYTFAQDVRYEDSWGHQLELKLGQRCQVLNFGVGGYGVDQAYLRYLRDVRPWQPDIVIFAFINQDVVRTMFVYSFLNWGEFPWAKPRFVLAGEQLSIVNTPLPRPEEIFSKRSIGELPFIRYDRAYRETEWARPYWRYFYSSYLFRLLISLYPRWEKDDERFSDRTMRSVNTAIFRSFSQAALSEGSIPIVVYLPDLGHFHAPKNYTPVSITIVRDAGLEPIDLTECLSQIDLPERFVQQHESTGSYGHYSPKANALVASCLHEVVVTHVPQENGGRRGKPPSS